MEKRLAVSVKKKIEKMKKMERGIEELEIVENATVKGVKFEDKSRSGKLQ